MTEQRFDTPRPVTLEVRFAGGRARVATTDGQESTVTIEGSHRALDATRVELIGDRLVIQQRRRGFSGVFDRVDHTLAIEAQVPAGSNVDIATASGDATLEGNFGDIQLKSASGELSVAGDVAGNARVETVSGPVRLPRVGGDLSARSVSADVSADSVDGSASVKSVSGRLHVGSLRQGTTNVQSVSGSVDLGIAPGTSIDIDAASASGELTSEIPLADSPEGGDGPTVVIRGGTVSGDVHVFRAA
jgi:DUF4097 and DUF4098 domain-containing protein YvlB